MTAIRSVACPGSPLGEIHYCAYSIDRGVWKCETCGLGGTTQGFATLTELEAERLRLDNELTIKAFELELAAGTSQT